jgi:hypothetical protein
MTSQQEGEVRIGGDGGLKNLNLKNHHNYNFNIDPILCRKCGVPIRFDNRWVAPSGKKIPLNPDLTLHYCPSEDLRRV